MLFGRKKRQIERILVVEDEPLVAFDTEHFLSDAGYAIVATLDRAGEAVRLIEGGEAIDLVVADVNLADGSGVAVAEAARARDIRVLFVTGARPAEAAQLAAGYLPKPYSPRDLVASIAAIEAAAGGKPPRRLPGGFQLFEGA